MNKNKYLSLLFCIMMSGVFTFINATELTSVQEEEKLFDAKTKEGIVLALKEAAEKFSRDSAEEQACLGIAGLVERPESIFQHEIIALLLKCSNPNSIIETLQELSFVNDDELQEILNLSYKNKMSALIRLTRYLNDIKNI